VYDASKDAVPDATGEVRGATELHHIQMDRSATAIALSTMKGASPINAETAGQLKASKHVQGT
jgi:hypothetical protein